MSMVCEISWISNVNDCLHRYQLIELAEYYNIFDTRFFTNQDSKTTFRAEVTGMSLWYPGTKDIRTRMKALLYDAQPLLKAEKELVTNIREVNESTNK